MTNLINAYCTLRDLPPLEVPHTLNARRDRRDPELLEHLDGFAGYVASRGEEMTQTRYHVICHIRRVQHHLSLNVEDDDVEAFAGWAWSANALVFFPDGTVRDPSGAVLVGPDGAEPDDEAEVPYPEDARARRERTMATLEARGVEVAASLPPVVSEGEVVLRTPDEVAARARALIVVAVRGESLAGGEPIPVAGLRARAPRSFEALSARELEFLRARRPSEQQVLDATWRYEALWTLVWALGRVDELPFPSAICDVKHLARLMLDEAASPWATPALRPASELLDALDLHYRLHWAVRQGRLEGVDPPEGVEPGVVVERHHALNWLVRFEDADWDDVDTPT